MSFTYREKVLLVVIVLLVLFVLYNEDKKRKQQQKENLDLPILNKVTNFLNNPLSY